MNDDCSYDRGLLLEVLLFDLTVFCILRSQTRKVCNVNREIYSRLGF